MANYGIKITREGKSVQSTDIRDFIFHSEYPTPKAIERQTVQHTVPANDHTQQTINLTHNLGYTPFFFISGDINPDRWYNLGPYQTIPVSVNTSYGIVVFTESTTTNVIIKLQTPNISFGSDPFTSDVTYTFNYYIIVDAI